MVIEIKFLFLAMKRKMKVNSIKQTETFTNLTNTILRS